MYSLQFDKKAVYNMSFVHKISSKRMSRKKGKINEIAIENQNENSIVIFKFHLKNDLKIECTIWKVA